MRTTAAAVIVSVVVLATAAHSQDTERYFRFIVRDRTALRSLARSFSIARVAGDTVYAYGTEADRPAARSLGVNPVVLPHPNSDIPHAMAATPAGLAAWDRYPTYQVYLGAMRDLASNFPAICRLDTIGYTTQGRLLLALKISDKVNTREDEPQCLYTSSMHGNELVGYVLMLRLADHLLTTYGQNTPEGARVTALIDNAELWINPLANPDGAYRLGGDTSVSNARRSNANGYDLNRNFPDRIADSTNTTTGRQAETAAFMTWTKRHNFSLSANFHCGVQVVNYPWDNGTPSGTYSTCPDDAWFVQLSLAYALPNPDFVTGGFTNGITNGCAWYEVLGGRQDWMYCWNGGRETTIELSTANMPAGSALPTFWEHNKESFLAYLEYSLRGIRGVVTNAATGAPVRARVDLLGTTNAPVFTDSLAGDYHRLLLPGTYSVVVRATGFRPDTLEAVPVGAGEATRADVALVPITVPVAPGETGPPAQFTLEQNYPNPFNGSSVIAYEVSGVGRQVSGASSQVPKASVVRLVAYDMLGREVAVLVDEWKAPGKYEVRFDAGQIASGTYLYRLTAGKVVLTRSMILVR
jgi:hypothetical protein